MNRYRCIYYDSKNNKSAVEEEIRAGAAQEAFQQFIQNRRSENWSFADIFRRSNLKIIPAGSNERYIIDSYGEVVRETDFCRMPG